MKKFLNKLSSSGRYEEGSLRDDASSYSDEEYNETHIRKSSTLPPDARDNPEDIKVKKSFSKKVLSPRSRDGMEAEDDFTKKRSASTSGGSLKIKDNKDKDKLNESDDKVFRKSFSLRSMSLFKSSDQVKNQDSMRSPSLKSGLVSQYEHVAHGGQLDSGDESSDNEDDASVPHKDGAEEFYSTVPIRVPSAPASMASPYASRAVNSPHKSPQSSPSLRVATPSSPTVRMAYSPPASPPSGVPSSPTARVPTLPKSPTIQPQSTSPSVVDAEDFDARFGRMRADSITDDYGADVRMRSDSVASEDVDMDDDLFSPQKGKTSGIFSFGHNKSKKLK